MEIDLRLWKTIGQLILHWISYVNVVLINKRSVSLW